jgi:hypothetical protein
MKEKIVDWFLQNRTKIGYTIGGLNMFFGLTNIVVGDWVVGLFWLCIGAFIIFDTNTYK